MSDTITPITAPTILLSGSQLLADGTQQTVTSLPWDQRTPGGSPASITTHIPIMFVGEVTVEITSSYSLKDYSAAPAEDDSHVTGAASGTQVTGNILYSFNQLGKLPSPTECKVYTGTFKIVKPGNSFSGKGYVFESDVISLVSAVQISGEVGTEALALIRII